MVRNKQVFTVVYLLQCEVETTLQPFKKQK